MLASPSTATDMKSFYEERDLLYCTDIAQLLHKLGVPQYQPKDWRLFIDSSKRSDASVPLAHSTTLKKKYKAVKYGLENIRYDQHEWYICVDLNMVNFLLGQQSGFTMYLCFLCMLDSRDRAPLWEELVPCRARNIINNPLVDRYRIFFPPLHIKLGWIKQFTKALDTDGGCFTYLCHAFSGLTIEK